jgi:carbamoyltransferase
MYILGLATMGDAAAVLMKDNKIIAAAEEERFSRQKHHVGFPNEALKYCLREAGITMKDIDHVGLYWKPWLVGTRIKMALGSLFKKGEGLFAARVNSGLPRVSKYMSMFGLPKYIRETFGESDFKFHFIAHHDCHAASAFYVSPFESAAILTLDGAGEESSTVLAHGIGNKKIRNIADVKLPHSLGQFYSAVTNYLGFNMFEGDEWKVMGLAAYGKPVYYEFLRDNVLTMHGDRDFKFNVSVLDHHLAKSHRFSREFVEACGMPRKPDEEIEQRHMDLAASAQKVVEEIVLQLCQTLRKETGEENLCLAGGVAYNSVMNGRLVREAGFKEVFVQPAAGDSGCAMGAALYIGHVKLGLPRGEPMDNAYLGPQFSDAECLAALETSGLPFETVSEVELTKRVAKILAQGNLIAWFQGRMEWGPRALGNRSFVGDPRMADMREVLNHKVKLREWFRPLAPSMLAEDATDIFGEHFFDPFMVTVHPVPEERRDRIAAVVHVDGTARPQTVERKVNPRYWQLLSDFKAETGVPVLLNTSFNIQEPIVCTPEDAINTFKRCEVDYLVLGNNIVSRPEVAIAA